MIRYALEKIVFTFLSLFVMVTLTFIMMKALPGDPFSDEKALPKEVIANLHRHYGLDRPLIEQYWQYLASLATLNFGNSIVYPGRSVVDIIKTSFPVSAILGTQAILLSLFGGVFFGTLSSLFNRHWPQKVLTTTGVLCISIPSFIMASLLQYIFGIYLDWLPIARWGAWEHTILPSLALAAFPLAYIARLVRTNLNEVLKTPYIKNAKAKGLSTREILFYHALPNSLIPVISYLSQFTTAILTGSFIVEKIFGIPGLGQWYVASITNRDYPVIMGTTIFYSAILLSLTLIADLIYCTLDPRIQVRDNASCV